ncbi:TspO/MBR family protein [Roseibium limicola]|uniref:Tryptophan-rich sensory protein n=1 Tax=Roseibium limicola TaxID=2816037 RepID=A0A939ERG7_9HYPH|nr:TspO/MBR family protein [Roseibium limicola]MBO0346606.1 tryptophan-rich sensory protein [Roseibium limicola]
MGKSLGLLGFLVLVVGGGLLIGYSFMPGVWYQELAKPVFTPPNWLFAPAWTTIYVLIAIAGWRTWQREGLENGMWLWLPQMALNFAWSPVVFGAHSLTLGLIIIALMWCNIVLFIRNRWAIDRLSALLFLPYLAWVSFATYLNASLVVLN